MRKRHIQCCTISAPRWVTPQPPHIQSWPGAGMETCIAQLVPVNEDSDILDGAVFAITPTGALSVFDSGIGSTMGTACPAGGVTLGSDGNFYGVGEYINEATEFFAREQFSSLRLLELSASYTDSSTVLHR